VKVRIIAVLLAVVALITVALAEISFGHHGDNDPFITPPAPKTFPANVIGIVSYNVAAFDQRCRCAPNVAVHYLAIGGSTDMGIARSIIAAGAIPMLELEPYGMSFAEISSGDEDAWLTEYANAVSSLHSPVIMSFAPEANGNWYTWGYPYETPGAFVRAWQHVVTVFRRAGVQDVEWAWIMNVNYPGSENIARFWPGPAFVNILGIDGYFITPTTFEAFFGPTIVAMRTISSLPLLITETGASPSAGKVAALTALTVGVADYGLVGFIWFDVKQYGSLRRQDWSLDDDPAALNLFSTDVNRIR
jgi:mannan endo-1,4-beta-mannosidase